MVSMSECRAGNPSRRCARDPSAISTAHEIPVTGGEIVIHHRPESGDGQRLAGVAADVSGSADDEGDWTRC